MPTSDWPICPACGLKVATGDDVHHSCRRALEEHTRPLLFAGRCDVCDQPVPEDRNRCGTCPPPELPATYRRARAHLDGL